jgi:epsilon-lactone hydrolase
MGQSSQAKISIPAQIVRLILRVAPPPMSSDADALRAQVAKSHAKGPAQPSNAFRKLFDVREEQIDGQRVWTASPRTAANNPMRILYVPGGAYVFQPQSLHWDIVKALIERTGATVVLPAYPVAPEHDWQPAYAMINTIYARLVAEVGAKRVVIAGDSAGGGITLSLAQQLRDAGRSLPAALVLFSPWLDVTLSDPTQVALDKVDRILSIASLRITGEWWSGDLPPTDPRISPLFGALAGLPPIAVFTGTDDLLYPDATRLAAKANEAGASLTLFTYPHMFHDWMGVTVLPEAARALDEAAGFIHALTPVIQQQS